MELKMTTFPLFCISSFLLLHILPAPAGSADFPLLDNFGRNVTSDGVYYLRNYNYNSDVGAGLALTYRLGVISFLGFATSDTDPGLAVSLVPIMGAKVIFPGDSFKFVLASNSTIRREELQAFQPANFIATGCDFCKTTYFSVEDNAMGGYSLMACGTSVLCQRGIKVGLVCHNTFKMGGGTNFKFFFEKKVSVESPELLQSH